MNFYEKDPEFARIFENFALNEVINEEGQELPQDIRYTAILATLLGCQGTDAFRMMLPKALDAGVTPVMAKKSYIRQQTILDLDESFHLSISQMRSLRQEGEPFHLKIRQRLLWKTVWKKESRHR